ncbi:TetR/AcrR family transcriptional regulator [Corallincola luteus]|uniref:TetR/AcrR family transcriptional regulator n=1 Tax=Corallincola luteus TaxID=1775177 RepID=A0ABY2AK55_9GAMM|nr:TetR/AcrR family transcriptional regulator [Corallincola luteus]TCI01796.1 TetR/AcrR family transcriptional regulator [Corallincola luteus]
MAKTIKYDRAAVVEKATNLYWEKGFHATSMRNLQDIIDMRPGSIYACFGSKEGLFKEALQHYAAMSLQQLQACKSAPSPINALKAFIKIAVIESQQVAPSGMCMLAKTIAELTDANADLLAEAKRLLRDVEAEFAEVIKAAKAHNEISESADPEQLARYIQIQLMGLRTYVRANDSSIPMAELIDEMFANAPFNA